MYVGYQIVTALYWNIVNIIYDYIEMTGGFLDEDTLAIPRAPLTDE